MLIKLMGNLRKPEFDGEHCFYRFITYHRIKPGQTDAFKSQLDRLLSQHNVVTPEEFIGKQGDPQQTNLLFTFDDGYREWETVIRKELNKRGIKALFFVCPDFVGLENDSAAKYSRQQIRVEPANPLGCEGLKQLKDDGHTIGNHLLEHVDLRRCTDQTQMEQVMNRSQQVFEERFGFRAKWCAYPFADYFVAPERLIDSAKQHFEQAVTLIPGWNHEDKNSHFLHRDGFSPDLSADVEQAWLRGGYDPVFSLTHLFS